MEAILRQASRGSSRDASRERAEIKEREKAEEIDMMRELNHQNHDLGLKEILGKVLLNQNILNRKNNVDFEYNVTDFCLNFPEELGPVGITQNEFEDSMKEKLATFEEDMMKRELNYGKLGDKIQAPIFSADCKPLKSTDKQNLHKFVQHGKGKFSGAHDQNIAETLEHINFIQSCSKMNKEDFLQFFVKNFTKEAFDNVTAEIKAGTQIGTIYNLLQVMYNRDMNPGEAKEKLKNFKAKKTDTTLTILTKVRKLTNQSFADWLPSEHKNLIVESESIYQFINAFPETSKRFLTDQLNKFKSKRNKSPTLSEFYEINYTYLPTLDRDIKINGASSPFQGKPNRYHSYAIETNTTENNTVNFIDQEDDLSNQFSGMDFPPVYHSNAINRGNTRINRGSNRGRGYASNRGNASFQNGRGRYNNNRSTSNFYGNTSPSYRNRPSTGTYKNAKYCSLCSGQTHNASDGCYRMRDNSNKVVPVVPIQMACPVCKSRLGKTLFHPEKFCFLRDSLKQFKRSKPYNNNQA